MIEIAYLADHPTVIPTLSEWFRAQWPVYFAKRTLQEIAQNFEAEAQWDGLPLRLLAFHNGELAGTITLRQHAIHTQPHYQPGIGGLFVAPNFRKCGIGTELVAAATKVAQTQGHARIYASTATARNILAHLEWKLVQPFTHEGSQQWLYVRELAR